MIGGRASFGGWSGLVAVVCAVVIGVPGVAYGVGPGAGPSDVAQSDGPPVTAPPPADQRSLSAPPASTQSIQPGNVQPQRDPGSGDRQRELGADGATNVTGNVTPAQTSALAASPARPGNRLAASGVLGRKVPASPLAYSEFARTIASYDYQHNPCRSNPQGPACGGFLYPDRCQQVDAVCRALIRENPCTGEGQQFFCKVFLQNVCRTQPYGGQCFELEGSLFQTPVTDPPDNCRRDLPFYNSGLCAFEEHYFCQQLEFSAKSLNCQYTEQLMSITWSTVQGCDRAYLTNERSPYPVCQAYEAMSAAICTLPLPGMTCDPNFGGSSEPISIQTAGAGSPASGGNSGGAGQGSIPVPTSSPRGTPPGSTPGGPGATGGPGGAAHANRSAQGASGCTSGCGGKGRRRTGTGPGGSPIIPAHVTPPPGSGMSTALDVGLGLGLLVLVGAGGFLIRRRRVRAEPLSK